MIPRIIHYCWFGGSEIPEALMKYIQSWREQCGDFEFWLWNEDSFDIGQAPAFVQDAYRGHKYAFVADYVRLYALYTHGGVYLDTDVELRKSLTPFLTHRFFTSVEYHEDMVKSLHIKERLLPDGRRNPDMPHVKGIGVQAVMIGAESGHPYIKSCMDFYLQNRRSIGEDKDLNVSLILPDIMAICAEPYGFRYVNELQNLSEGMVIYPNEVFAGFRVATDQSVAVHYAHNSWRNVSFVQRIYGKMSERQWMANLKNYLTRWKVFRNAHELLRKCVWFK